MNDLWTLGLYRTGLNPYSANKGGWQQQHDSMVWQQQQQTMHKHQHDIYSVAAAASGAEERRDSTLNMDRERDWLHLLSFTKSHSPA